MVTPLNREPDTSLLLLVFRLLGHRLRGARANAEKLYAISKRCYHHLETAGLVTRRLVQSLVLLAYYEIANAVFPGGFLTVGLCVRLGHVLGIHVRRDVPLLLDPNREWLAPQQPPS